MCGGEWKLSRSIQTQHRDGPRTSMACLGVETRPICRAACPSGAFTDHWELCWGWDAVFYVPSWSTDFVVMGKCSDCICQTVHWFGLVYAALPVGDCTSACCSWKWMYLCVCVCVCVCIRVCLCVRADTLTECRFDTSKSCQPFLLLCICSDILIWKLSVSLAQWLTIRKRPQQTKQEAAGDCSQLS